MTTGYIDSYYSASAPLPAQRDALSGSVETDVAVVGGGFTGLSAALHLSRRGYRVVLLEAERAGWGASGRNGGHVGIGQRRDQAELEALVGEEHARGLWALGLEAVGLVRDLIADHGIDCDLKRGILHVAAKPAHAEELREYCRLLQQRYGYGATRYVDREETRQMLGTGRYHGAQLDRDAAHLHPLKYALGLARAAEKAGATLHEASRVTRIDRAEGLTVHTSGGEVRAKRVVLGCNGYLGGLDKRVAGMIMPINNFILATEPLGGELARELIRDDVAVADTLFVINYWKLSADNRLLFGGGENYTRRFPRDIKAFVRKYLLRVYPQLADTRIDYAWGGTLAVTMSRMPSYGCLDGNVYYAQGFSGHGVPTATLAGALIAEAIDGDRSRFDLFARLPTRRFPGGTYLRWPGLVAGMAWHSLLDKL